MSRPLRIWSATLFTLFCFSVSLAGCGGGGGSAKSGELVDPASSFKGVTTEATPTDTNAEALAMGGFGGGKIALSIRSVAKTGETNAETTKSYPVFQFAQMLKQSVRRMEIPQKAAFLRTPPQATAVDKRTGRASNYQLKGDNGGTATYTLDINDSTGSFFGTVVFEAYNSDGIIIDGTTEVLGVMDASRQQPSRLTLSFRSLTLRYGNSILSMSGSLSYGFNLNSSTETLSMNIVLLDQATARTYWYNNYELITVYSGNSYTQTISGRYYDHDFGYVDLTTQTPLITTYGNQWPSQGSILFTGRLGRWARLIFHPNTMVIEADTDGNGEADWRVERSSNIQPLINTPPIADAGPDQNVSQFTTVHLEGSASSDKEGDPLSYTWTVVTSPGYTALSGANTPAPSFTANITGTYTLSLTVYDGNSTSQADTVTVVVTTPVPKEPAFVKQEWQYGSFGENIGQAGLFTADLDGDGTPEIITTASTGGFEKVQWYVLRRSANGGYEQVYRSPIYGLAVIRILLADMNNDGKDDVVVGLSDGTILIYDGTTLKEIRNLKVTASLKDFAVAELDGDGTREIVTSDGIGVSVYNAQTGARKWSVNIGGGDSIAVGNVDSDPTLEIVTTSYGGKGFVLDGLSGTAKWAYINSLGAKVRLADLDGDGMQEIIGASSWNKITIFDADLKSPTWEIATSNDIGAVTLADADGDGIPEIIYGDGQWGKIHAVDVRTHAERWFATNPEHGVSGIAMGDVDNDGKKELLWGAGGTSSGPDYLYIADPLTNTIKWQNLDFYGLSALAAGDVDGDGVDEVVMVSSSSNSFNDRGIIHVFNAQTHTLKYQVHLGTRDWMGDHRAVRISDVDRDGHTEIVISTSELYDGSISVYDGATGTLKQRSSGYDGSYFSAIAIADVDKDGKVEIVAGQGVEHTGATGAYIIVFDGVTLQEKWRSTSLMDMWAAVYDIKIADLNQDGRPDIIASLTDRRLVVIDGVTHIQKLMIESPARAIDIADVDGDGFLEILVGRNDGKIDIYDGVAFAVKNTVSSLGITSIDALRFADIDGNGIKEWLIASNGILSILDAQGLKWRTTYLGSNLGKNNSIAVKDIDGEGRQEIFIGSDPAFYEFK